MKNYEMYKKAKCSNSKAYVVLYNKLRTRGTKKNIFKLARCVKSTNQNVLVKDNDIKER